VKRIQVIRFENEVTLILTREESNEKYKPQPRRKHNGEGLGEGSIIGVKD